MPLTTIRTTFAIAAASALLLACGGEEASAPPKAADPAPTSEPVPEPAPISEPEPVEAPSSGRQGVQKEMDPDGKTVTLKGTDAAGRPFDARVGANVEIPEYFPEDVPIFPEAAPMASMRAEGHGSFVSFRSDQPQEDIYDYYREQLVAEGWKIESENDFRGQSTIESTKDTRKIVVTIAGTEGDARVSVVITEEE